MKFDIAALDRDIAYLRDEAQRVRRAARGDAWGEQKGERLEQIAETLRQVRQAQQMRGMSE